MAGKKILIIDDEKNVRENLKRVLEPEGYEVALAINGEDGLSQFEEEDFALVLLDMKLPGIDGMEVLRRIADADKMSRVIMITGYGTIEKAVEAMKLGAVDFLRKPFSPEEIRQAVEDVMKRFELEKMEKSLNSFHDYLQFAKSMINRRNFSRAIEYLEKAVSLNSAKPEPFNLMGAIKEMEGNHEEARKLYRAALAIDPTYKPASDNLDRITDYYYSSEGINLGDEDEE